MGVEANKRTATAGTERSSERAEDPDTSTVTSLRQLCVDTQVDIVRRKIESAMAWNARDLDSEWPFDVMASEFRLAPGATALLVVDMQVRELSYGPDSKLARHAPAVAGFWNERIETTVVPNIRRLIAVFRAQRLKIAYTRNGNVTSTADEMSPRLRRAEERVAHPTRDPDSRIDGRLAPRDEDLVLDKLTSGAFTASFLDHALRNMGLSCLVVTGILTDMCVLGTARVAAELGYETLICEDACATLTARAHVEALLVHARRFGRVATTDEVIGELEEEAASVRGGFSTSVGNGSTRVERR